MYNAASEKIAEGYAVTKEAVVNSSHVVAENAAYAAEKVKEGAAKAYETVAGVATDAK